MEQGNIVLLVGLIAMKSVINGENPVSMTWAYGVVVIMFDRGSNPGRGDEFS